MQVIKNGAIYLGSSLLSKALPLLMLPVMTRYLTPAEFGAMAVFLVIYSLFNAIVGMAMHSNVTSNFYSAARSELALIIGNAVIALSTTAIAATAIAAPFALAASTVFSVPAAYLLLMPLLAFTSTIAVLNTTVLRNEGRAGAYASFEISQMLVNLVLTLSLLLGTGLGWHAQVAGLLAANLVSCAVGLAYLRRRGYLDLRYDKGKMAAVLQQSLPMVPHALGGMVIAVSDRLFIERMVGIEAVGLYAIGYSFGMAMGLFTDATMKAWTPWLYRTLALEGEAGKRAVVRSCYLLIVLFLGAAAVLALAATWLLPYIVSEAFLGAGVYIAWVTLGYAVRGIYQIFFPFLVHMRKTHFLAFSTLVAAALNLGLNYVLIGRYGAIGGAYATILSFAASAWLVFWFQKRHFPMPWFGERA